MCSFDTIYLSICHNGYLIVNISLFFLLSFSRSRLLKHLKSTLAFYHDWFVECLIKKKSINGTRFCYCYCEWMPTNMNDNNFFLPGSDEDDDNRTLYLNLAKGFKEKLGLKFFIFYWIWLPLKEMRKKCNKKS